MYTAVSGGGAGAGAGAGATESSTATTAATTEHSKKAATSAMQAAGQHALVHVSRFLGATELARLSCVNKFTHGVLDDPSSATMDKAWAEFCKQAWEEKCVPRLQVSTSTMLHDADLSGAGVAAMLSIKQMKHVLRKHLRGLCVCGPALHLCCHAALDNTLTSATNTLLLSPPTLLQASGECLPATALRSTSWLIVWRAQHRQHAEHMAPPLAVGGKQRLQRLRRRAQGETSPRRTCVI